MWKAVELGDAKAVVDEKMDKISLAMIYQGMPVNTLMLITEKKTTKEGWKAIKVMCQEADHVKNARVQTLKAKFKSLCIDDSEQLDDFHMKLVSTIWALGEEMIESYAWGSKLLHTEEEWSKREKNEAIIYSSGLDEAMKQIQLRWAIKFQRTGWTWLIVSMQKHR